MTEEIETKAERPGLRRYYLRTRIAELKKEMEALRAELKEIKPERAPAS